jgi:AAA+ ATPase superfamily predicted ATPase
VTLGQRLAREDARRFVGRERELGVLESLLADDPPAAVAFVHGAAGIGKSALLR